MDALQAEAAKEAALSKQWQSRKMRERRAETPEQTAAAHRRKADREAAVRRKVAEEAVAAKGIVKQLLANPGKILGVDEQIAALLACVAEGRVQAAAARGKVAVVVRGSNPFRLA